MPAGSYKAISTIPVGYRPSLTQYFKADAMGLAGFDVMGRIDVDGIVYLYASQETNYWTYSFVVPIG